MPTYLNTWDETVPAGSRDVNLGDNDIRAFKAAIRERFGTDHYTLAIEGSDSKIGYHKKVSLLEQNTDPSVLADSFIMYAKVSGAFAELHARHEDIGIQRLTNLGKLWVEALGMDDAAKGEFIKHDGTKFTRMVKGQPLQQMRINSAGDDAEWATITQAASQAEMEAATSDDVYGTPLNLKWHPGIAKALANINGTNGAIRTSYGLTTASRVSTGKYSFTWSTAFSSGDYYIFPSAGEAVDQANYRPVIHSMSTTGCIVMVTNSANSFVDPSIVCISAFGDQ